MKYSIEKQIDGYCLIKENGLAVVNGAPHMRGLVYFKNKKEADRFADLLNVDTFVYKEDWTPKHYALFETIPEIVRKIAGDLFEIKWYGHESYDGMLHVIKRDIYDKSFDKFKEAYDSLTDEQKNLIYYAYEA